MGEVDAVQLRGGGEVRLTLSNGGAEAVRLSVRIAVHPLPHGRGSVGTSSKTFNATPAV
jgi:hypothetical protein